MPDFLYVYHGGKMPETPEAQAASMAAWGKWMTDNGPALVDPGNPVGMSKTVHAGGVDDNGGSNPTSGYTIIRAGDMQAAVAIAKSCPIVKEGGSIEIAEIHKMEM